MSGRTGRRALTLLACAVLLVLGAVVLWPRRAEVLAAVSGMDPRGVVLAAVLTSAGVVVTAQVWATWVAGLGGVLPALTAHRVFYLTQSAKYLPGGVWPVAAQAAASRRFGVPVPAMVTASTMFLLTHVVTGAAVGLALVGGTLAADPVLAVACQVTALVGLAVLTPPGTRVLVRLAHRVRPGLDLPVPSWRVVGAAVAWMLLAWLLYGGAVLALASATGGPRPGLLLATGAFASAWAVGFVAVAVPAGVGVREAVLVAALAPVTGAPAAIAVAVVSRAVFTVVDLALAVASAGVLRAAPDDARRVP